MGDLGFPITEYDETTGLIRTVIIPARVLGGLLLQLRFRVEYNDDDPYELRVTGERRS